MPYRHEVCKAGRTKQHTYYYAVRADTKEGSRRKKWNRTSEAQRKVNSRQRVKKLTWILNENFDGTSLYVTWSYAKDVRPAGKEELRGDIRGLLKKIRKTYKEEGTEVKYVWVAEIGKRGAAHIHMVMNGARAAKLKKCWDKGWITIKPLDDSGQYRKLAAYLIKYSEETMRTAEGFSGKSYNPSRNLKIPQPTKTTVRAKNAYSHTVEVPEGWHLDKESIAEAWHEVTGFMYFTYTLIRDDISRKRGKDTYTLNLDTGEVEITEKPQRGKKKNTREGRKGNQNVSESKAWGRHGADGRGGLGKLE